MAGERREAAEKEVKTKTKREEGFRSDSMRGYAHNGPYTSNPGRCLFQRSGLDIQQKCSKTPKTHNKHTKKGKKKKKKEQTWVRRASWTDLGMATGWLGAGMVGLCNRRVRGRV